NNNGNNQEDSASAHSSDAENLSGTENISPNSQVAKRGPPVKKLRTYNEERDMEEDFASSSSSHPPPSPNSASSDSDASLTAHPQFQPTPERQGSPFNEITETSNPLSADLTETATNKEIHADNSFPDKGKDKPSEVPMEEDHLLDPDDITLKQIAIAYNDAA